VPAKIWLYRGASPMFPFAKKPVTQDGELQDLTEEQLTQVAGGNDSVDKKIDNDDKKKNNKKEIHHHHHHHHHHYHYIVKDNDPK
jgi:ABC-type Zn2+ transport system substrate-binding protein/surface adhesin